MAWLKRDRVRVAWEAEGEGPLVVCVPGMGDTRAQYRLLAPALVAAGRRVVVMDPRGHGESDVDAVGPEVVGEDVVALVADLGAEEVVLVGNSAGGAAVVWAAAALGSRARAVVLLGPVVRDAVALPPALARALVAVLGLVLGNRLGARLWTWWYQRLFVAGVPADQASHVSTLARLTARPGRLRAALAFGLLPKAACAARATAVTAPTLALLGRRDPDYPDVEAEAAWLRSALRAEVEVLEGTGHYPHLEVPAATAARVVRFLGEAACPAA